MMSTVAGWALALVMGADPVDAVAVKSLGGVWLADAAEAQMDRPLGHVWFSQFTVERNTFRVSKLLFNPKDLTGTFTLDPTTTPKSIDLKLNELDYTPLGFPGKIPAMTLPGIYKLDGDRLTICFHTDPALKRPTKFAATDKKAVVLTLGRASETYKGHPTEVTVAVKGPDGKPLPKAKVFYYMGWNERRARLEKKKPEWSFADGFETGEDGTAKVPYDQLGSEVRAWAPGPNLIGRKLVSPFALQNPSLTIQLEPAVLLKGSIVCDEFKTLGLPIGSTNSDVYSRGMPMAGFMSADGKFEIPVPPGEYELDIYGEDLCDKKVPIKVPGDRSEFELPPIQMSAAALPFLKGKPAPELEGVVGWKGDKVRLADLKGKYVLLEFWGYWCNPCVASMPVLFELHDKFKDKGLVVVGVHLDVEGEVDTATKLDEKLVDIRKKLWKGRDLPFSVALCSGERVDHRGGEQRRGGIQYGVLRYPTTILIDREGKVVGRFKARDAAEAVQAVEKLLAVK